MRSQPLPDQIHIDRVRYALWNRPGRWGFGYGGQRIQPERSTNTF